MAKPLILPALTVALLCGCAGGSSQGRPDAAQVARIDRALSHAPGAAQPGIVVAAEIALARTTREQGQWAAWRASMAAGAVIDAGDGPVDAATWLAGRAEPPQPDGRGTRAVWMSCDVTVAISRGRYQDAEGAIGTYITIWQRQPQGDYRWSYDSRAIDDPQPDAVAADGSGESVIVVTADDLIQGRVADCPKPDAPVPPIPPRVIATGALSGSGKSPDSTLSWAWESRPDGVRILSIDYYRDGAWQDALRQRLPDDTAGQEGRGR